MIQVTIWKKAHVPREWDEAREAGKAETADYDIVNFFVFILKIMGNYCNVFYKVEDMDYNNFLGLP
jgi:hypothetical protein